MRTEEREVVVVIGAGAIGQAIARRIGVGKLLLLADINQEAAQGVATALSGIGFDTESMHVDVSSAESVDALAGQATKLGKVIHVVHTAGLSPAQARPEAIVALTSSAPRTSSKRSVESSPPGDQAW